MLKFLCGWPFCILQVISCKGISCLRSVRNPSLRTVPHTATVEQFFRTVGNDESPQIFIPLKVRIPNEIVLAHQASANTVEICTASAIACGHMLHAAGISGRLEHAHRCA